MSHLFLKPRAVEDIPYFSILSGQKTIFLQEISIFFQILHHISGFTQFFAKRGHILIDTSSIYFLVKKLKENDKILVPFGALSMHGNAL